MPSTRSPSSVDTETTEAKAAAPLRVPRVLPAHFGRNFIRQSVCELRFPTLFELEGIRPPLSFAKAMRRKYPNHSTARSVEMRTGEVVQGSMHQFQSQDRSWTVNLRAASISIETMRYESFAPFLQRLGDVVKAASEVIDSDFFTRVGLRYINILPVDRKAIDGWLNEDLSRLISCGALGEPSVFFQRVAGIVDGGRNYMMQYGWGHPELRIDGENDPFVLDFDLSAEDVLVSEAISTVELLHADEFDLFSWAIGPRAREHLGRSTLLSGDVALTQPSFPGEKL